MTAPRNPARRAFLLLASTLAATLPALSRARAQRGGDNGIGGTGYAPPVGERDNGLGGTGVIGTIRRFGSIYVNNARIAYPRNARVTIDGRPARANDLRIGHVVTLLASGPEGGLATQAIAVTHEVVGVVESVSDGQARVLGQDVILPRGAKVRQGQTIAVSGLRTPDQTIVASLIEKAPPGRALVTGVVEQNAQGGLMVGNLPMQGLASETMGQRARISGELRDGVFVASAAEPMAVAPAGARRLLLETYARSDNGAVTTPSGFTAVVDKGARALNGAARVILSADRNTAGGWTIRRANTIGGGPQLPRGPMRGGPAGPDSPGGAGGPGMGQGGPRGPGGPGGGMAPRGPGGPTGPGAPGGHNLPGWPGAPGGGPGGIGPGGMGPGGFGPGGFGGGGPPGMGGGGPGGMGGGPRR